MMPDPLVRGAKSTYHGWPSYWDGEIWRYADDNTPLPGWGGINRSCRKCGAECKNAESDSCLGDLPGVDNACCGHGDPAYAYIRFTNGMAIEGFTKIHYPDKTPSGKE